MFGKYAAFILPSYVLTFLVIGGLVVWIAAVHRSRRRELARLEGAGATRHGMTPAKRAAVSGTGDQ